MKYWKCVKCENEERNFKIGKIYETDDNERHVRDEEDYLWNSPISDLKDMDKNYGEFVESTRREYLLQLEKEGKLKFNEEDFANGDLAVRFDGVCEFSEKLCEICKKHKITNIWNFNINSPRELYFVFNKKVHLEIPHKELATINAWEMEISKEDKEENREKEIKMTEFKVGDKVRIIKNLNGHEFKIGEVVIIIEDDESKLPYKCTREDGRYVDSPWVDGEEIELADSTKDFELNISSKDGITSCTYKLNGELKKNESVKLYYKDTFDIETAVDEVLKKVFAKKPHEVFEINLQKELGHKPTSEELVEAYRKEMK